MMKVLIFVKLITELPTSLTKICTHALLCYINDWSYINNVENTKVIIFGYFLNEFIIFLLFLCL